MFKIKCAVCKTALEGHYLTLTPGTTPLSFSESILEKLDATNLAFECGNNGCDIVVCHQCIAKMERRKEGRFLFKREHLICPKCQGSFGEGGTHVLVEGRFPPEIHNTSVRVGVGSDRHKWALQQRAEDGLVLTGSMALPTSVCSICLGDAELRVVRVPDPYTSQIRQLQVPLCRGCHLILTLSSIEFPGLPIVIRQPAGVRFVNAAYMDLVKKLNPHLNWRK